MSLVALFRHRDGLSLLTDSAEFGPDGRRSGSGRKIVRLGANHLYSLNCLISYGCRGKRIDFDRELAARLPAALPPTTAEISNLIAITLRQIVEESETSARTLRLPEDFARTDIVVVGRESDNRLTAARSVMQLKADGGTEIRDRGVPEDPRDRWFAVWAPPGVNEAEVTAYMNRCRLRYSGAADVLTLFAGCLDDLRNRGLLSDWPVSEGIVTADSVELRSYQTRELLEAATSGPADRS